MARTFFHPALDSQALVAAAPPVSVREIFRRFWPYARPYRRWLVVGLTLIAAVPAVDTAMIWMFKLVVDEVLVPQTFGPLVGGIRPRHPRPFEVRRPGGAGPYGPRGEGERSRLRPRRTRSIGACSPDRPRPPGIRFRRLGSWR
jgi:hypothetical protein